VASEWANEPALREAERDDDEDDVKDQHDAAHRLRHLPLEDDDRAEDEEQHDEEHADRAANAHAVHLKHVVEMTWSWGGRMAGCQGGVGRAPG